MRPILLAMNNPFTERPGFALFPAPVNCAGWRLWKLLEARRPDLYRQNYIDAFDRRNLVAGRVWSHEAACEAATRMIEGQQFAGRVVLLLGTEPRRFLGLGTSLIHPQEKHGGVFRQLPHPSGRCLWYNDPQNRLLAGMLLEELYEMSP